MNPFTNNDRLVGEKERREITTISRTHCWRLEKKNQHPIRIHLGPRRIAWKMSELVDWVNNRAAEEHAQ